MKLRSRIINPSPQAFTLQEQSCSFPVVIS